MESRPKDICHVEDVGEYTDVEHHYYHCCQQNNHSHHDLQQKEKLNQ